MFYVGNNKAQSIERKTCSVFAGAGQFGENIGIFYFFQLTHSICEIMFSCTCENTVHVYNSLLCLRHGDVEADDSVETEDRLYGAGKHVHLYGLQHQ